MRLEDLKPAAGATKKAKRVGRGVGSGHGKTAGKGHKGQKARSGGVKAQGLKAARCPFNAGFRRAGFTNIFRKEYAVVNLDGSRAAMCRSEPMTPEMLMQNGLIKNMKAGVKVLGMGELKTKLTVRAHKFSKSAVEKIQAAGGKAEVI